MTACKIKHLAVRWLLLHYKNLALKSWGFKKSRNIYKTLTFAYIQHLGGTKLFDCFSYRPRILFQD